jgi:sugar phosphate isomerase/epimerase
MAIKEGDIVRLTGVTAHGSGKSVGETTYRVYGLWPRGSVKLREVREVITDSGLPVTGSPFYRTDWITAQPERTKEVAIHFVTKVEE